MADRIEMDPVEPVTGVVDILVSIVMLAFIGGETVAVDGPNAVMEL